MAKQDNPFFDLDQMSKMMQDFKMPGVDVEAVINAQRRNIEAMNKANRVAMEGMQAVAQRQAEIMRQTMEELSGMSQRMMDGSQQDDGMSRQTELTKQAMERALSNMRELAEMVSKANNEAFEVVHKRFNESMDELRDELTKLEKKQSGGSSSSGQSSGSSGSTKKG